MLRAFSSSDEFLQYLAGVRRADRGTDYSVSDLVSILYALTPGLINFWPPCATYSCNKYYVLLEKEGD